MFNFTPINKNAQPSKQNEIKCNSEFSLLCLIFPFVFSDFHGKSIEAAFALEKYI